MIIFKSITRVMFAQRPKNYGSVNCHSKFTTQSIQRNKMAIAETKSQARPQIIAAIAGMNN